MVQSLIGQKVNYLFKIVLGQKNILYLLRRQTKKALERLDLAERKLSSARGIQFCVETRGRNTNGFSDIQLCHTTLCHFTFQQ